MKTRSLILSACLFLTQAPAMGQDADMPWYMYSPLPLQAAVCDVIGVGRALSQDDKCATFQIDQFWYGGVTNNPVQFHRGGAQPMPTNGTPVVFFASKYQSFLSLQPPECHYTYIFDMDYHRSRYQPDGLCLYDGDRSWFPATAENAAMVNWCSNLVQVSQVNTNRQAFYELIRDGYRLNPESSRMHRDSEYTFMHFHYFNNTNFMKQVWSDTNLVGWARAWVNMSFQGETKTWLP
ncbi:MAG: hypothetical protein ACOX9C_05870 [Kiritimatiellia bacterium]|jgi:hypothetical protein